MPELPEVQTTVDDLKRLDIIGQTVQQITLGWPAMAGPVSNLKLNRFFRHKKIQSIARRGKHILFRFHDGARCMLHLRMSGRLKYVAHTTPLGKHEHLRIRLDNNRELRLHDPRKFGRLLVNGAVDAKLAQLGIEPLSDDFTIKALSGILLSRKKRLKPLLLDQSLIAGLGNICADECLWMAQLHPLRIGSSLTKAEIRRLRESIVLFLQDAIARGGTSLGDGEQNFVSVSDRAGNNQSRLKVYSRNGQPCPRCHAEIERIIVAQRGTYLCPRCQEVKAATR